MWCCCLAQFALIVDFYDIHKMSEGGDTLYSESIFTRKKNTQENEPTKMNVCSIMHDARKINKSTCIKEEAD